jgi:hypothetical protein
VDVTNSRWFNVKDSIICAEEMLVIFSWLSEYRKMFVLNVTG